MERLRWYVEDSLGLGNSDQVPRVRDIATAASVDIAAFGVEFWNLVFENDPAMAQVSVGIEAVLPDLDVELEVSGFHSAWPWELLRRPTDDGPLIAQVESFVRSTLPLVERSSLQEQGFRRVLIVISRNPGTSRDVAYQNVLGDFARSDYDGTLIVDVLRPATVEALEARLVGAREAGQPYQIVHIDAHGGWDSERQEPVILLNGGGAQEPVYGEELGNVLRRGSVDTLFLSACRSANLAVEPSTQTSGPNQSFARQVIDKGIGFVIGMRHDASEVTVREFYSTIYRELANGRQLLDAVRAARKRLQGNDLRRINGDWVSFQDWFVPVVYANRIPSLPLSPAARRSKRTPRRVAAELSLIASTPAVPSVGLDLEIQLLDKLFSSPRYVWLHGQAGRGKTTIAHEYARWHLLTQSDAVVAWLHAPEQRSEESLMQVAMGKLMSATSAWRWGSLLDATRQCAPLLIVDNADDINEVQWDEFAEFVRPLIPAGLRILTTSRRSKPPPALHATPFQCPGLSHEEAILLIERRHPSRLVTRAYAPLVRYANGNALLLRILASALPDGHSETDVSAVVDRHATTPLDAEDERLSAAIATVLSGYREDDALLLSLIQHHSHSTHPGILAAASSPIEEWAVSELIEGDTSRWESLLSRLSSDGLADRSTTPGTWELHPSLLRVLRERGGPDTRKAWAAGSANFFSEHYSAPKESETLQIIATFEDDIVAALGYCSHVDMVDAFVDLTDALQALYHRTGRSNELRSLVERSSAAFLDEKHQQRPGAPFYATHSAYSWRGRLVETLGRDYARHVSRKHEEWLLGERTAARGDRARQRYLSHQLVFVLDARCIDEQKTDQGLSKDDVESLELCAAISGKPDDIAKALYWRVELGVDQSDVGATVSKLEEALTRSGLTEPTQDRLHLSIGTLLLRLGQATNDLAQERTHLERAKDHLVAALEICKKLRSAPKLCERAVRLAFVLHLLDEDDDAEEKYEYARRVATGAIGTEAWLARALGGLGQIHLVRAMKFSDQESPLWANELQLALAYLTDCAELADRLGHQAIADDARRMIARFPQRSSDGAG